MLTFDPEKKDKAWPYKEEFNPNVPEHWLLMFQKVNRDCSKSGEPIMLFDDIEAVTGQIYNLVDEQNYEFAQSMAIKLKYL